MRGLGSNNGCDGIVLFLARANLLLNSIHSKIQDDPEWNFRDEFEGLNSLSENNSREIGPSFELTRAKIIDLDHTAVNSSATDIVLVTLSSTAVETAIAQCASRWAMARGHRLNTSIVLAAVHGLSGLFRAVSTVEPSLSRPLPTLSPSVIGHLASVDVKQHESKPYCFTPAEARLLIRDGDRGEEGERVKARPRIQWKC